jgi:hypothetical protein
LVYELENLKGFKGIGGEVNYDIFNPKKSYESRGGMKEIFIVQCMEGGKAKKLTDWTKIQYP